MNHLHALEFFAKHSAFKTVTAIAQAAGVDTSNLHACLARKRSWPQTMVHRVAYALGLEVVQMEPTVTIQPASRTVIHIAIHGANLGQLVEVLETIAVISTTWLMMLPYEEPPEGTVQAIALGHWRGSYLVLHLSWDSMDDASAATEQLFAALPGLWAHTNPEDEAYCVSLTSPEWIRMRAGIESIAALDRLFGVQHIPRVEEWAQMLIDVNKLGLSPDDVTRLALRHKKTSELK